jgi:kynurenine formamidase
VKVEEGDVLLIRTGRSAMRKAKGAWDPTRVGAPGLDAGCLEWLHDRKIAVLGSDSASDVMPSGDSEHPLPIHVGTIVLMGVHLIDNTDFDALSEACARAGRYEFLFSMGPLILERGTASPVNPVAIL